MANSSRASGEGASRTARILLVDDHPVVRNGLRLMLKEYREFEVVAEAENCDEALQKVASLHPDLVLMDINLGNTEKDGIHTTRLITAQHPGTQVIIISMGKDKADIRNAIEAGAVGYLLKDVKGPDLARALRTVLEGGSAMSPDVSREILREFSGLLNKSVPAEPREALSEKEREVLLLLCQGKSNRDIGTCLFITEKTVKSHITSILRKLGVKDRTQAVIKAIQQKMVEI
jgi:DNA-binding NarL/FixJ family response regulator